MVGFDNRAGANHDTVDLHFFSKLGGQGLVRGTRPLPLCFVTNHVSQGLGVFFMESTIDFVSIGLGKPQIY